jgi:hypothetical protein
VLRRVGGFAVLAAFLLAWGAADAATPQRAAFRVTLTGTLTKDWTVKRTVSGDCDVVTTTTGRWKLTVATRRPTAIVIVRPAPGRRLGFSPGLVRSIAGSASRTGSVRKVTQGPRCERTVRSSTCPTQRKSFRGATTRITSPVRGRARLTPLQGASAVRSFRGNCPEEPTDIRSLKTDLDLADAPLSAADAFDRSVPRFFISGDSVLETTIEEEYDGKAIERVRWRLTFTRLAL